jgi:hypothetical protein
MLKVPTLLPSKSLLLETAFCDFFNLEHSMSTLELKNQDADLYANYHEWYLGLMDSRRLRNPSLTIETRLAAYLRLIGRKTHRFRLAVDAIPSGNWLRQRLDVHRNTICKYVKDAQTTGRVAMNIQVGCQMAFAAAIYPPPSKHERSFSNNAQGHRLDLIDDYHLTGRNKLEMVSCLSPITRSGKNELFTVAKQYPCLYDLDPDGQPVKRTHERQRRTIKRLLKKATKTDSVQ